VIKNRAVFGGITFYGSLLHHQKIVDGTVRLLPKYVFLGGASKETAHWLKKVG